MAFPTRSNNGEINNGVLPRRMPRTGALDFKRSSSKKTARNKPTPPEQTNAENFYYLKQMNSKTPMVLIMTDGEEIRGWIEWYDRSCLKLNREGAPNLVVNKHCIKYLFKEEDRVPRSS